MSFSLVTVGAALNLWQPGCRWRRDQGHGWDVSVNPIPFATGHISRRRGRCTAIEADVRIEARSRACHPIDERLRHGSLCSG